MYENIFKAKTIFVKPEDIPEYWAKTLFSELSEKLNLVPTVKEALSFIEKCP